jgi:hypothetical protein
VYFEATLKVVTSSSNRGVWEKAPDAPLSIVFRRGDAVTTTETLGAFQCFTPTAGSPGQGRALVDSGNVALWNLNSRRQVLAENGVPFLSTGDLLNPDTHPGAVWAKLRQPSFAGFSPFETPSEFAFASMLGTVRMGSGTLAHQSTGIFLRSEAAWAPLVLLGDSAPGIPSGVFRAFNDPVSALNSRTGELAFSGKVSGVPSNSDEGIWWKSDTFTLLAREGDQPPGAPAGAKWKSFGSLAYGGDDSGPIFTAKLQPGAGGITSANDSALYAVGTDGNLRELMREGVALEGKTVKSFIVLKPTVGSAGVTRSFNNRGTIAAQVTYSDGSVAIVAVQFPSIFD